jgi:hydroxyacylglutathione hydrolase
MPLDLLTIPCLADNYAFLLADRAAGTAVLVDAPEAGPILGQLAAQGLRLTHVLLTHHHDDHIQGVPELVAETRAEVWGAAADAHRLPPLTRALHPGERVALAGEEVEVIDVPGHTVGHIAFNAAGPGWLFSGDSLMAAGCGRLFEGTPAQMWQSLARLALLPDATVVCSGHEYTTGNLRFAVAVAPDEAAIAARAARVAEARAAGRATVPSTLGEERATNPFLLAATPAMKARLGMAGAPDSAVFAELRARKDRF